MAPAARAVRAYVAPVGRPIGADRGLRSRSSRGNSIWIRRREPWLDLGWVENFQRTPATKYEALRSGPVGNITVQYRTQPEARLEFDLPAWGKLQMALTGGTQMMNVLATLPQKPAARLGRRGDSGVAAAKRIYRHLAGADD